MGQARVDYCQGGLSRNAMAIERLCNDLFEVISDSKVLLKQVCVDVPDYDAEKAQDICDSLSSQIEDIQNVSAHLYEYTRVKFN